MQGLARRGKTAKAKFSERKYSNDAGECAARIFRHARLHRARASGKYTQLPKPEALVLDQDKLTIESSERNQRRTLTLQDYPVIWAFVESIRSTLAGDLKTLNRFYRATLEGTEAQWRLLLQPRTSQMQTIVREIRISGSKNQIRAIEINETEGNRSVMTISEDAPVSLRVRWTLGVWLGFLSAASSLSAGRSSRPICLLFCHAPPRLQRSKSWWSNCATALCPG